MNSANLAWSPPASAQDGTVVIPVGQSVQRVAVWGRPVEIAGAVADEVVVVLGDVSVRSTGRVGDRLIILGGQVKLEPGARVGEGVFALDLGTSTLNGLVLGLFGFGVMEVLRLLAAVGCIAVIGTGGIAILAGLTAWGPPLAFLLAVVAGAATFFGLAFVSLRVGDVLAQSYLQGVNLRVWQRAALGGAALTLLTSFPVVGLVLGVALLITAFGCTILYIFS